MRQVLEERRNKYEYSLVDEFPDVREFSERVFCGTFSYTTTKSLRRLLVNSSAVYSLFNVPQTAPEIARDYLDIRYPTRLRCSSEQRNEYITDRPHPLYFQPFVSKDAVYLDIQATYWSIMALVGWDVDYMPGKFLSPGRAPYDFPLPGNKLARNCLLTAGGSNQITVWTGSKFINTSPYNVHLNLGLHTLVTDILHSLAVEAIYCGAHYVNTDGYILPSENADELFQRVHYWGLPLRLKGVGETIVTGLGSYRVGEHHTKVLNPDFAEPYSNIYPVKNVNMLRKTLHNIAVDRVDRPYLFAV